MSDKTAIEWTDATWNPIRGCSHVSEGCRNCYAERVAARFSGGPVVDGGQVIIREFGPYHGTITDGKWNGQIRFDPEVMDQPLRWKRPRRIFVNSMSDLFHENVPDETIDRIFRVMWRASWHTFQVLTKRPERMLAYVKKNSIKDEIGFEGLHGHEWPLPNVWLGVSVENQRTADERIPLLLQTPADVRFVSCEPLLGAVDIADAAGVTNWDDPSAGIHWIIAGGESGFGARPMNPDWARGLRDQCHTDGVPFFFKQWGEWSTADPILAGAPRWVHQFMPDEGSGSVCVFRVGKKASGRMLDGRTWDEFPGT